VIAYALAPMAVGLVTCVTRVLLAQAAFVVAVPAPELTSYALPDAHSDERAASAPAVQTTDADAADALRARITAASKYAAQSRTKDFRVFIGPAPTPPGSPLLAGPRPIRDST
jgi:hypothetical protein